MGHVNTTRGGVAARLYDPEEEKERGALGIRAGGGKRRRKKRREKRGDLTAKW